MFKEGDEVVCTFAATGFYTPHHVYKVTMSPKGLGITGNDGIFDLFSTLQSKFKKKDSKETPLTVVPK